MGISQPVSIVGISQPVSPNGGQSYLLDEYSINASVTLVKITKG